MKKRDYVIASIGLISVLVLGLLTFVKTDQSVTNGNKLNALNVTNACARDISGEVDQTFQRTVGVFLNDSIEIRDELDPEKRANLRNQIKNAARTLSTIPDKGDLIAKRCVSK